MKLLRIEHPVTGTGPYTISPGIRMRHHELARTVDAIVEAHKGCEQHPSVVSDFRDRGGRASRATGRAALDAVRYGTVDEREIYAEDGEECEFDWACAFSGREQLTAWFSASEIEAMQKAGFELIELELHSGAIVADSGLQVVYRPEQVSQRTAIAW